MPDKMPVLFIGHGSPMNVVLDNDFTRTLADWGKRLPRPGAIMVISAHWLTPGGTFISCTDKPRTIHDFYGFPKELYAINYPSPGAPEVAKAAAESVKGFRIGCDDEWGLDHGAWSVLKHLFPKADIPVFQLSLDYSFNEWNPKPLQHHYDLAAELTGLRERGVMIIGSGNIVHNLSLIDWNTDADAYGWGAEFDGQVKKNLISRNHRDLVQYEDMGEAAALSVPTLDHYLPMIYTVAMQGKDEPLAFIFEGFQNGSISMRCFQIG
jgi:4,5-DOPA dioxygenase extradiol